MANTSKVKTSKNLFLGKAEIDRTHEWLKEGKDLHGQSVYKYGIYRPNHLNPTSYLKVFAGSTSSKISVERGIISAYGDLEPRLLEIPNNLIDIADVPTDSVTRQVYLKWVTTTLEEGTCDLAANGQLTGTGTNFLEVLRGQPNFPARIEFEKSGLINTGEYDVIQVLSITDAWINNPTQAETGLKYKVIGTFVPDAVIPSSDKEIFEYGTYQVTISSTPVAGAILLADVTSDGSTLTIVDKRNSFHTSKDHDYLTRFNGTEANDVVGVEWAKYGSQYSDQGESLVKIGWGIRSSDWTFSHDTMRLSVITGSGGICDSVATVPNGACNGWRVYFKGTDKWARVVTSTTGGALILSLAEYNQADLPASGVGDITVVPDCDKIQIRTSKKAAVDDLLVESEKLFPIQDGYGIIEIRPMGAKIEYSQHWAGGRSIYRAINDGNYHNEAAFDSDGVQTVSAQNGAVLSGEISLTLSPSSFAVGGMHTNTNNVMLSGGSITDDYVVLLVSGGIIQIPSTGIVNLGHWSGGGTITGIVDMGIGHSISVVFVNPTTLTQSATFNLGIRDGSSIILGNGGYEIATFRQVLGTPAWMLESQTSFSTTQNNIQVRENQPNADSLNLSVINSNSSKSYNLIGHEPYSGTGVTLYFPQGSGMITRYNDPSPNIREAWHDFSISVSNNSDFTSIQAARYKIIGKTLFLRVHELTITPSSTPTTLSLNNLAFHSGLTFHSVSSVGTGFHQGSTSLSIASLDALLTNTNILILKKSDNGTFTNGANVLSFQIAIELA